MREAFGKVTSIEVGLESSVDEGMTRLLLEARPTITQDESYGMALWHREGSIFLECTGSSFTFTLTSVRGLAGLCS